MIIDEQKFVEYWRKRDAFNKSFEDRWWLEGFREEKRALWEMLTFNDVSDRMIANQKKTILKIEQKLNKSEYERCWLKSWEEAGGWR